MAMKREMVSKNSQTVVSRPISPRKVRRVVMRLKDDGNIKVSVRVRPAAANEVKLNLPNLILMDPETNITQLNHVSSFIQSGKVLSKAGRSGNVVQPKVYKFDNSLSSFDPNNKGFIDQQTAYEKIGKEYLKHTLNGYNTCIFAYGQTGAGKSYTMMGTDEEPGLIPRICKDLFRYSENLLNERQINVIVKVSYFEIYNEFVYDLLNSTESVSGKLRYLTKSSMNSKDILQKLKVRESPETGPYVENLSEFTVKNFQEVCKYFRIGNSNRMTAATRMNLSSSRSHAIFSISVKQIEYSDILTNKILNVKHSTLRLTDLAGSERSSSTTGQLERLKEGSNINKSLTCLGRVINSLAKLNTQSQEKFEKIVVPYRDSTLTWILKDSLGGNSKTAMIACISPCDYEETLSTLRYANNAKKIKTEAKINKEDTMNDDMTSQLEVMQNKINELESALSRKSLRGSIIGSTRNEKEKELIRATEQKISNNYKKYFKLYQDKLTEEDSKNHILVNEINKLQNENKRLNLNLDSIIGPILDDMHPTGDDIAESHDMTNNLGSISPRRVRIGQQLSPTRLSPHKRLDQYNKENNGTFNETDDHSPSKIQKFSELSKDFDELKSNFAKSSMDLSNDLTRFHPNNLSSLVADYDAD